MTNSTKLNDIPGAREALPNKVDMNVYLPITTIEKCVYDSGKEVGNNKAVDKLDSVHLEVDVEAMAKAICLAEYPDAYIWDHLNENEKEFYRKLARGTSGTILEWARLVRR